MADEHAIEASGSSATSRRARAPSTGSTSRSPRRDLRLPRAERRGQVDDGAHAHDAAAADGREGARRPASTSSARARRCARDRRRAAGGRARPAADGPRAPAPADLAARHPERRARSPRRRAARARRARRSGRPQGRALLGRDEAPPRPRARARPPPRILFLDEPTTGLDSRAARRSGTRSRRLAQEDGVTVFLTTQYLEEADVLANRVGIIDHGRIVAEGTPAELKAEIGRPTVEASRPTPSSARARAILEHFGEPCAAVPERRRAAAGGEADLADDRPRARRRGSPASSICSCTRRSLDDVFLAKTGRTLEGAGEEEDEPELASSQRERRSRSGRPARAALGRAHAAPARERHPAAPLPAAPARRQLRRPQAGDAAPGLPDRLVLAFALAVPFIQGALFATMNAGTDLARDIQTGFLNRLALTPMRGIALLAGQLGGVMALASVQAVVYRASASPSASTSSRASAGSPCSSSSRP